jgi:hypothetical protein
VDAISDERGQAILAVVLAVGIAAVAIVGLRDAQERIVLGARAQRAGEAAVEAAAQSVADAYAARPSGRRRSFAMGASSKPHEPPPRSWHERTVAEASKGWSSRALAIASKPDS